MAWKTLEQTTLIDEYHVSVQKNRVQLPQGDIIDDFYIVTIPDAVIIAALTDEGTILLKREYRYACGCDVIECPSGMVEKTDVDLLFAAKRELKEETGYESDTWTYLGPSFESTSKLTNRAHLFLAEHAVKTSGLHLDEHEYLTVMEVSLADACAMVMTGEINANSTAHLILKAARLSGV